MQQQQQWFEDGVMQCEQKGIWQGCSSLRWQKGLMHKDNAQQVLLVLASFEESAC